MGMKTRIARKVGALAAPAVLSRLGKHGSKAASRAARSGNETISRAGAWAADRLMPNRRRRSPFRVAATGLGAAALALLVGLWLGRRGRAGDEV